MFRGWEILAVVGAAAVGVIAACLLTGRVLGAIEEDWYE
jgi:hypothetical protein